MPAGRPKKPRELKIAEGTWRPDRDAVNPVLPTPVGRLPPLPYGVELGHHGLQVWGEMCDKLTRVRVLTENDLQALAAYCAATEMYWTAMREVRATGGLVQIETATGIVVRKHPAVDVASSAAVQMKAAWTQFGLTPADRQKIEAIPEREEANGDEWGIN
jgi:P27 family predicted phage terminase small subunit